MDRNGLIDRAHLAAQTFGDDDLAADVLVLFAGQCARLVPGIRDEALGASTRADLAHTLLGSALGVGAAEVAATSATLEAGFRGDGVAAADLQRLERVVAATLAEIADGRVRP